MKKLKLEFWHKLFTLGDLLYTLGRKTIGLNMINKGMDKMEYLIWEDPFLKQYAKKRGMIR